MIIIIDFSSENEEVEDEHQQPREPDQVRRLTRQRRRPDY